MVQQDKEAPNGMVDTNKSDTSSIMDQSPTPSGDNPKVVLNIDLDSTETSDETPANANEETEVGDPKYKMKMVGAVVGVSGTAAVCAAKKGGCIIL